MIPTGFRARALTVMLGLSLACRATAVDEPAAKRGSVIPSDPSFQALKRDGTSVTGHISQLGADQITLSDGSETTIPLDELVKLTREAVAPTFPPEGTLILLPEGDRLRAVIGTANDTKLDSRSYALGDLPVPLESLLGLVLSPPSEPGALEDLIAKVREQPRDSEVIWLSNGDRLTGGFLGLTARHVAFQPDSGALKIDRSQVLALGFDPSLVNYPRPKGTFLEITLADGSRLGVTEARIDKGQLEAKTRYGATVHLAITDLARIHVRSDSIVYLSERTADASEYVSYIGPKRPYRRDLAVDGRAMRLAGQPYSRGIGTQSRTLLAYRLAVGDRRFQALVGLDDRAGPEGSVVFRVRVDGKEKFASPPMSMREPPKAVDIDVAGGKVLILETDFGERGDVRDLADWAEARLIR